MIVQRLESDVHPSQLCFESSPCWLQVHNLPPNWRKISIGTRIAKRANTILEFDLYSLQNNFLKAMSVKFELTLSKTLVRGVRIPLSTSGSSPRFVWADFRYKRLP